MNGRAERNLVDQRHSDGHVHISHLAEDQRPTLLHMLESSGDFPQELVYLYRRRGRLYSTLVAWHAGEIVGVLTGSFDSDLASGGYFASFALPPAPHAFLDRIHVWWELRRHGVGRQLILAFASEAFDRGCTFIGGSIDLSSDPTERRTFFEEIGFSIRALDNFGAAPGDLRERLGVGPARRGRDDG